MVKRSLTKVVTGADPAVVQYASLREHWMLVETKEPSAEILRQPPHTIL